MADPLLLGPPVSCPAPAGYDTAVAATGPGHVGESFRLRAAGQGRTDPATGLGSAILAPWPVSALAAWAAVRGTRGSSWPARTVALVGTGIVSGTLAELVTWGRRRSARRARASLCLHLVLGASMMAADTDRLGRKATAAADRLAGGLLGVVFGAAEPRGRTQRRSTPGGRAMAAAEASERGSAVPPRTALYAVLVVSGVSLVGAAISVRTGLNPTYRDAVGPHGYLSVPLPMMVFQLLTALAAGSPRRAVALLGSGMLGLAVTLALVSGFFDGGYADERLDWAQRCYQMVLAVSLCVVAVLAAARLQRVGRLGAEGSQP